MPAVRHRRRALQAVLSSTDAADAAGGRGCAERGGPADHGRVPPVPSLPRVDQADALDVLAVHLVGGVFGSMLSTPILNPPQSAILGMHNIVERPVVKNGEIVVRPIMYVALSYDHRIIDGRESVSFLVRVKELLEDPGRLILGV